MNRLSIVVKRYQTFYIFLIISIYKNLFAIDFNLLYSSTIFNSFYNEYPAVAVDKKGNVWIVCTGVTHTGGEAIFLTRFYNNTWEEPQQVSSYTNQEFNPKIVCDLDDNIWVVWCAKRQDQFDIYARRYDQYNKKWSEEYKISDDKTPDFNPVIVVDNKNNLYVAWESLEYNNFSIKIAFYNKEKWSKPIVVSSNEYKNFRPSIVVDKKNNIWVAWDGYKENKGYDIFLRRIDSHSNKMSDIIQVTRHPAYDQAPSLAVDSKNRIWIAFHSNRAETNTGYDIIKWTTLLCYDGENFYEPFVPMKDKDTNKTDEDQGSEFPTIIIDDKEVLWIFSRASQSFKLQLYHVDKWTEIKNISLPGWGGRGDRVNIAYYKGKVFTVQRDVNTTYFQIFTLKDSENIKPEPLKVKIYKEKQFEFEKVKIMSEKLPSVDIYNVYFGDLHTHSSLSDGMGTVEEVYPRSKDIYGLDFAALTDHDWFVGNRILNSEWDYVKLMAKEFYQPGRFVTIPAHEWTTARVTRGGWGHKNIYYYEDDPPMFGVLNEISSTSTKLIDVVKKHGAIVIPHHIGWTGVDWENHDEYAQPVYEIISGHGAYEFFGNLPIPHRGGIKGMFVQDGWRKGLIFGVVGGSDTHGLLYHHGISLKRDPYKSGLTAVLCEKLTRDDILNALRQRRCYATSGEKIFVDFRINRFNVMGSKIKLTRPPLIYVYVKGTNKIVYVYLLRNNEVIYFSGRDLDQGYGSKIEFVDEEIPQGYNYYYVRVVQEDNEIAVTSPIWVEYLK